MYLKGLVALALKANMPVLVFDLETSTMRGRCNFGITEFSGLLVKPDGEHTFVSSLVNPEHKIDADVVTLTGITQSMVAKQQNWGQQFAGLMDYWGQTTLVVGFNNKSFDCPAAAEQNARYGFYRTKFDHVLDVKSLAQTIWGLTGKLGDIGTHFGEHPDGALHRAQADVSLTARILDKMAVAELDRVVRAIAPLERTATVLKNVNLRLDEFFDQLLEESKAWEVNAVPCEQFSQATPLAKSLPTPAVKPSPAPRSRTSSGNTSKEGRIRALQNLLNVEAHLTTVAQLREALAVTPEFADDKSGTGLDWALVGLIDSGEVSPLRFLSPTLAEWFRSTVPEQLPAWEKDGRRLKALMETLSGLNPPESLDYVLLRGGLDVVGANWPTRERSQSAV